MIKNVHADYIVSATPTPTSQISINKMVKNPQSGQFVDNLNANEFTFLTNQEVLFRLEVKNNGQTDLNNIQVKDKLPDLLDFESGPGTFDSGSRTLTFSIDKLTPGQSKTFDLKAKTRSNNLDSICVTNFAQAQVNNLVAQDTAVVCITKTVLPNIQQLPVTGPSSQEIVLLTSLISFVASILIFRKLGKI